MTASIELGWELDAWVITPLAVSGTLYAVGTARMWHRAGIGRGVAVWQVGAFGSGWLTLICALVSPLHELAEHLFVAHMIEHELLMALAAPLMALSRPTGMLLHGLPRSWRIVSIRSAGIVLVRRLWDWLMKPVTATILHGAAIWIWHLPLLLDATLEDETLHRWQHISFFGTAIIFWWAIFRRPKRDYGTGAGHVFMTMMHTGLLGALLTLAPRVFYPLQTADAPAFGLSPLQDQQLAGLFMWVPAGAFYLVAGLVLVRIWLTSAAETTSIPSFSAVSNYGRTQIG